MTQTSSTAAVRLPGGVLDHRTLLTAAFAFPIWLGVLTGVFTGRWWTFGSGTVAYGDLNWVATWSECLRSAGPLNGVDVCEIAYPLPSVWLGAAVNFDPSDVALVGDILSISWATMATALVWFAIRVGSAVWGLLVTIVLCAPPAWLMLQRGNLDIIVWTLVMVALILAWDQRRISASLVTAFAVLLKIFPLGMTLSLLLVCRSNWRRAIALGAAPVIAGVAVVAGGRYVSDLRPNPVGDAFAAFHSAYLGRVGLLVLQGESVEPTSITVQVPPTAMDYTIGGLGFLSAAFLIWLLIIRCRRLVVTPKAGAWLLSALGLILFSFLTGANFDYRLTFLAFVIVGLCLAAEGAPRRSRQGLLALGSGFAAVAWLSVSNPVPVQLLGDGLLWVCLAAGTAICVQVVLQAKSVGQPMAVNHDGAASADLSKPRQP
jgi:hypothetical protein